MMVQEWGEVPESRLAFGKWTLEFAVTREVENRLGADSGGKKVKIALFVGKLDVANARERKQRNRRGPQGTARRDR